MFVFVTRYHVSYIHSWHLFLSVLFISHSHYFIFAEVPTRNYIINSSPKESQLRMIPLLFCYFYVYSCSYVWSYVLFLSTITVPGFCLLCFDFHGLLWICFVIVCERRKLLGKMPLRVWKGNCLMFIRNACVVTYL